MIISVGKNRKVCFCAGHSDWNSLNTLLFFLFFYFYNSDFFKELWVDNTELVHYTTSIYPIYNIHLFNDKCFCSLLFPFWWIHTYCSNNNLSTSNFLCFVFLFIMILVLKLSSGQFYGSSCGVFQTPMFWIPGFHRVFSPSPCLAGQNRYCSSWSTTQHTGNDQFITHPSAPTDSWSERLLPQFFAGNRQRPHLFLGR